VFPCTPPASIYAARRIYAARSALSRMRMSSREESLIVKMRMSLRSSVWVYKYETLTTDGHVVARGSRPRVPICPEDRSPRSFCNQPVKVCLTACCFFFLRWPCQLLCGDFLLSLNPDRMDIVLWELFAATGDGIRYSLDANAAGPDNNSHYICYQQYRGVSRLRGWSVSRIATMQKQRSTWRLLIAETAQSRPICPQY
jgi:hypothetical protein